MGFEYAKMCNVKKILLIEDTEEIRENIIELLELHRYNIIAAEDGEQGMNLVYQFKPDVIICDVKMPKMGGFELINVLQEDEAVNCIPFIFISASAQKSDLEQGKHSGAFAYLTKPFTAEDLITTIEMAYQSSKISFENKV